jgi:protein-tyrosine phosphatase
MDAVNDDEASEEDAENGIGTANAGIVVVDAEDSGANVGGGGAALGYDINQQMEIVYAFNLADGERELQLPALTKKHRSAIGNMARKLKLSYMSSSLGTDAGDDDLKRVVLSKPAGYVAKVWATPFGPSRDRKKGYDKIPVGPTEVVSGFMWLGSGRDADNVEHLRSLGVTHVLNVTSEWKEAPGLAQHKVVLQRVPIKDFVTESMAQHLEQAFAFIDEARNGGTESRLLVHCVIGKSRSATVVLAYLMARERMTLRQAYDHVRSKREIRPNDGFFSEVEWASLSERATHQRRNSLWRWSRLSLEQRVCAWKSFLP